MTIPRQLGPETGPRIVLPDYSRSAATLERMVESLRRRYPVRGRIDPVGGERAVIRTIRPPSADRDILLRAGISVLALAGSLAMAGIITLLWSRLPEDHAPGIGALLVLCTSALAALICALLGIRFGLVALGTARSRVEITDHGVRVVGALRSREVPWDEIVAVESRAVHPVHWLTAALRLRDGSRVLVPALDRHIWTYARPSGREVRVLRTHLHLHRRPRGGIRRSARPGPG